MSNLKKVVLIVIGILLFLVIVTGVLFAAAMHSLFGSTNYETEPPTQAQTETETETEILDIQTSEEGVFYITETANEAKAETEETEEKIPVASDSDVYNILLIGVDERPSTGDTDSGTVMLLSVNDSSRQRSMITLNRDLTVEVPGQGEMPLDQVYGAGGGTLTAETVTENFRVLTERYMVIQFSQLVDIVDELGGIPVSISQEELDPLNENIRAICAQRSESPDPYLLTEAGTQPCGGIQAVAYSRIDQGEGDAQAVRQYEIISAVIGSLGDQSITGLYGAVRTVLSGVTHNVPELEILGLLVKVGRLSGYEELQETLPSTDLLVTEQTDSGEILTTDWTEAAREIQTALY